jgi:hypothetical protein
VCFWHIPFVSFLFWVMVVVCLSGSCEGPKVVLFFSLTWVSQRHGENPKLLFWFSWQSGCGGAKKFYFLFTYMGALFFGFLTYQSFSWIHCFPFMSFCSSSLLSYYYFFFFCVMERWESCMLSCK